MGYRSEVIFGVKKEHREAVDKVLKEHDLTDSFKWYERTYDWYEFDKDSNVKVTHTEYWIVWVGDYLKWYDGYPDVDAVNRLISDYCELDKFMVCMGEDGAIHSEQGDWYNYVEHISKLEISMTNPYLSVANEKR
tara:strand:- start:1677 stop:2081 length:405 start_codon:yes stop_codon:yes gene_type:complete